MLLKTLWKWLLSLVFVQTLFICQPYGADLCADVYGAKKEKLVSSQRQDLSVVLAELAWGEFFLQQNAAYLPKNHCGGTCSSIAGGNNLLAMAEALNPGSVTKGDFNQPRSRDDIQSLHKSMIREFFSAMKLHYGRDASSGMLFDQTETIFRSVAQKLFPFLEPHLSFAEVQPMSLESVSFEGASTMLLNVQSKQFRHTISVEGVIQPNESGFTGNSVTEFQLLVRDPHNPSELQKINVYQRIGKYFIEGYGYSDNRMFIGRGRSKLKVSAGEIYNIMMISYDVNFKKEAWSYRKMVDTDELRNGRLVKLFLIDGRIYKNIFIQPRRTLPNKRDYLPFRHLSGGRDEIRYEDIAHIELM